MHERALQAVQKPMCHRVCRTPALAGLRPFAGCARHRRICWSGCAHEQARLVGELPVQSPGWLVRAGDLLQLSRI
ncbi:MAG: hypothetical protein J7455_17045, partial [Roseiflexus sp.]|nr:hypothetical protein [Roseiflexus sp.]